MGRIPAQTSTNGWPVTSTSGSANSRRQARLLATRRRDDRRAPRGADAAQARTPPPRPARSSMPCIGSTTIPRSRRSAPHTCSSSSASCVPSTQIRLARAVRAAGVTVAIEPDAVNSGPWWAAGAGSDQRDRRALDQEPALLPPEVAVFVGAGPQGDGLVGDLHDVAAEPRGAILDDHAELGGHLGEGGLPAGLEVGEDVAFVHVATDCGRGDVEAGDYPDDDGRRRHHLQAGVTIRWVTGSRPRPDLRRRHPRRRSGSRGGVPPR